jgi:hypothetical protein
MAKRDNFMAECDNLGLPPFLQADSRFCSEQNHNGF